MSEITDATFASTVAMPIELPMASGHISGPSQSGSSLSAFTPSTALQLASSPTSITSPYCAAAGIPISQLLEQSSRSSFDHASEQWTSLSPIATTAATLTLHEAYLVHHYAGELGRWLDCTDASRQFTLKIPALVKTSPILLHAVISYAARHLGDTETAEQAHERCVELLIHRLSSDNVAKDDVLLCAIVILRVFEQLNGEECQSQLRFGAI